VLQLEVLVGELVAVDGLAASAVALGEVTTLDHEVLDDTVERGALVTKALLASSKSSEVLGSLLTRKHHDDCVKSRTCSYLGDGLAVETEDDTSKLFITRSHIEVDLRACERLRPREAQRVGLCTLWVILGPLTASEDWAKKTKVKVRITNSEMMSLWKPAMIDVCQSKVVQQGEMEREGTDGSQGQVAHGGRECGEGRCGCMDSPPWHLRRDCPKPDF
jgi:hypothetical protein